MLPLLKKKKTLQVTPDKSTILHKQSSLGLALTPSSNLNLYNMLLHMFSMFKPTGDFLSSIGTIQTSESSRCHENRAVEFQCKVAIQVTPERRIRAALV